MQTLIIDKGPVNMDKNICEEIRLIDNILQAEDFIRLRIQAGFAEISVEHARKALQNDGINVSAIYNDKLVGIGRLVGDNNWRRFNQRKRTIL